VRERERERISIEKLNDKKSPKFHESLGELLKTYNPYR
jgi:hypothetical protein